MWLRLLLQIKFHSDCERARLVIELLTCNLNCFKDSILSSARQYQKCTDVVVVQSIRQAVEKKRSGELRRSRRKEKGTVAVRI